MKSLKTMETETLKRMRGWRKDQMEAMQEAGQWERADSYHAEYIAPINAELSKRKVW